MLLDDKMCKIFQIKKRDLCPKCFIFNLSLNQLRRIMYIISKGGDLFSVLFFFPDLINHGALQLLQLLQLLLFPPQEGVSSLNRLLKLCHVSGLLTEPETPVGIQWRISQKSARCLRCLEEEWEGCTPACTCWMRLILSSMGSLKLGSWLLLVWAARRAACLSISRLLSRSRNCLVFWMEAPCEETY